MLHLRYPLILLAIVDIYFLAQRLSPWQEIFNLPLNGAVGIDPAICLAVYCALYIWLPGGQKPEMRAMLGKALLFGLGGGALLIGDLLLRSAVAVEQESSASLATRVLFGLAIVVWGLAGFRAGRTSANAGLGLFAGVWSAMTSSLMAASFVLIHMNSSQTSAADPWQQYQGLAIGTPATQALVEALNSATFYLLVGPLLGLVAGFSCALFGQKDEA